MGKEYGSNSHAFCKRCEPYQVKLHAACQRMLEHDYHGFEEAYGAVLKLYEDARRIDPEKAEAALRYCKGVREGGKRCYLSLFNPKKAEHWLENGRTTVEKLAKIKPPKKDTKKLKVTKFIVRVTLEQSLGNKELDTLLEQLGCCQE